VELLQLETFLGRYLAEQDYLHGQLLKTWSYFNRRLFLGVILPRKTIREDGYRLQIALTLWSFEGGLHSDIRFPTFKSAFQHPFLRAHKLEIGRAAEEENITAKSRQLIQTLINACPRATPV
jgi:hypothetical protein